MTDELEHRAEAIISKVLSLATVDRSAAVQRACGGNAELLERVQSLLSALPRVGEFMSDVTVDAGAQAPVTEKPGSMIGRYKLLEQIGEGGFGVVFMAEQEKPVRRMVALKVIKLGMDTREVVARFEAERQALMDHPNIAKVLDAGATDAGRPYFVMELVRGSPITDYCDKRKLNLTDRVALMAQVCRAVQHAHSKGIIHRDLKPTNVLVTVADDKPMPKVIDFGIAKATQAKLTDRTLLTGFRQLIGTPQYMSPEQADSDGVDVDTRTDVYSLGVLLYELLVGTTPFDARALRSVAFEAMRKMIRETEPAKPSTKLSTLGDALTGIATARGTDAKRLSQVVRGELDWIVMKSLEKDRARRYETASALGDDLNRYLAGEAVMAGPVSGMYRLQKTLRRYKAAVVFGSAIAACLLLGIAGTTTGLILATHQKGVAVASEQKAVANAEEAQRQKSIADAQRKDALTQKAATDQKSAEARATLDFFTDDILAKASPNNTKDAGISKVLVDALITPALKTIDQRFANQPLVRASIQRTLAVTLLDLGRADLAEPQARAAWDACRRVLGDNDPETLAALDTYANSINTQGRHAEAEQLLKRCWDARRRVQGDDHPDTLTVLNIYAAAIEGQGRHAEAEQLDKQWHSTTTPPQSTPRATMPGPSSWTSSSWTPAGTCRGRTTPTR